MLVLQYNYFFVPFICYFIIYVYKMSVENTTYQAKDTNSDTMYYGSWEKKKKKRGISIITLLIVVVCTAFITFIIYKNVENIKDTVDESQNEEMLDEFDLIVWDIVSITWNLTDDGNLTKYTHGLHTAKYGTMWLNSANINLSDYEGIIKIKWKVSSIFNDMYILDVIDLDGEKKEEEAEEEDLFASNSGEYIEAAGLFFSEDLLKKYDIINRSADEIHLQNKENSKKATISYFTCQSSNPSKNCKQLEINIWWSAEKNFATAYGLIFYKMPETANRYFHNGDMRWYFMPDTEEAEVTQIAKYLVVPNKQFVENKVMPNAKKLCKDDSRQLDKINKFETEISGKKVFTTVKWTYASGSVECSLEVDPGLLIGARLSELKFNLTEKAEEEEEESTEDDADDQKLSTDDVKQFAINLDKTLTFESRQGHKITFPAGNISYAPGKVLDASLDQAGVSCRSQTNVVEYGTSEEERDANPSIKIYECSIKNWFDTWNKYRHIKVQETRNFVIEVIDPAWKNFANHIVIE